VALSDLLQGLREPATIRLRCAAITRAVDERRSGFFTIDRSRLDDAAARVERLMRARFPSLVIPYHSRWRHFEAGGVDRRGELEARLQGHGASERARAMFDLTVVSVLLDAGAGAKWRFNEQQALASTALPVHRQGRDDLLAMLDKAITQRVGEVSPAEVITNEVTGDAKIEAASPAAADKQSYSRSEGLGVASFRAFMAGAFSAEKDDPLRVDAATLKLIDAAALRAMFQASPSNPLVGLEGRAGLLARLGQALAESAARHGGAARPSRVFDEITQDGSRQQVSATELLQALLRAFAPIWAPGNSGSVLKGVKAGDVWPHRFAGGDTPAGVDPITSGWVPFHKLSQWLAYSLLEPLQWAGVNVTGLEALTGLPEYRNGGLLLDCGVIVPRSPAWLGLTHKPGDEGIIEWRALTVSLLDELAQRVRQRLGKTAQELPLACILEGGTWAAGREIATELRGGSPPLAIDSDGTVF
jgi:Protein of unknown function (DUF1688)